MLFRSELAYQILGQTTIDNILQNGIMKDFTDAQFTMDQGSRGVFLFYVYDTDDGGTFGESITAEFDLPDGVILYDVSDTAHYDGVLDCDETPGGQPSYFCAYSIYNLQDIYRNRTH